MIAIYSLISLALLVGMLALWWRPEVVAKQAKRIACWWFGCWPDHEAMTYDYDGTVPCARCGAADTTYADRCGDTRHARMVDRLRRLRWRLIDSWRTRPCPACGKRGKCAADCDGIPF